MTYPKLHMTELVVHLKYPAPSMEMEIDLYVLLPEGEPARVSVITDETDIACLKRLGITYTPEDAGIFTDLGDDT